MSLAQRLRRLEELELDHWIEDLVSEEAVSMAKEYGGDVAEIAAELREAADRIRRYGLDAEIRQQARETGQSEDEVRAEMEAIIEERKAR